MQAEYRSSYTLPVCYIAMRSEEAGGGRLCRQRGAYE